MSYPSGDQTSPPNGSKRGQRPSLDRPSLFAGMEDGSASEDTQRVRILSTLESTRRSSRPNRTQGGRQTRKGQRSIWLQGALWGAMGMGVLALMAGFVMVIQDSQPAPLHAAPAAPVRTAKPATGLTKADTSVAALNMSPASSPDATLPQGPAVIETTASVEPASVANPAPGSTASAAAPVQLTTSTSSPQAEAARKLEDTPARAKTTTAAASKSGKSKSAKGQDDDVALLEAMFAHTGRKPAAPAHKN